MEQNKTYTENVTWGHVPQDDSTEGTGVIYQLLGIS